MMESWLKIPRKDSVLPLQIGFLSIARTSVRLINRWSESHRG
jgi:hypothetical protein